MEMTEQEYNNWWFIYYCEMGVQGFTDPRDNDQDYYDLYREQQERLLEQRMNDHFDYINEILYI